MLTYRLKFPVAEVKEFQRQLREIESNLEGNPQVIAPSTLSTEEQYAITMRKVSYTPVPANGQEIVIHLLGRCLLWSDIMLNR